MSVSYKVKYYLREMVKYTPLYQSIYRNIKVNEDKEKQLEKVKGIVDYAIKNVPFYSNYSSYLKDGFDIEKLPIIHKEDIVKSGEQMVSRKFNKKRLLMVSTGGTTGPSVNIYQSFKESVMSSAYVDFCFSLLEKKLVICSIREHDLTENEDYRFFGNRLMLAPNKINADTIEHYVSLIRKYNVNCLHVYPSSLQALCKLIEQKYGDKLDLPIKGIYVSSEIFSDEVKALAKKIFPKARILNFYGQTELVGMAIGLDAEPIQFIGSFSYVELIGVDVEQNGNRIAEIVCTGFKKSMPLIRYATGDFVEIDQNGNIKSIIGRTSDFLIGKNGEVVPCIIVNREDTMKNVILVQYYQDEPGKFIYNIIGNENFGADDIKAIDEDIKLNFGDILEGKIVQVDHIEKTKRGKHRKIIQKLDVNYYLNKQQC